MFLSLRHFTVCLFLGLAVWLVDSNSASAGWMGFRNDTGNTLVIQETVASRGVRPQKIFANETVRDTPPSTVTVRTFTIYEAGKRDQPLYSAQFPTPDPGENILYAIKLDGRGQIKIEAVRTPSATGVTRKVLPKR